MTIIVNSIARYLVVLLVTTNFEGAIFALSPAVKAPAVSTQKALPPTDLALSLDNSADISLITPDDIVLGNPAAKVIVIEYFSLTCAQCAYYKQEIWPVIKKRYLDTNKITYVMREFIANKQDLAASLLTRCNQDQDSFLSLVSMLCKQQDSWMLSQEYREILTHIGQLGGVSAQSYAKCLNDQRLIKVFMNNTAALIKSPEFAGIPVFLINGQLTNIALDQLASAIEDALKTQHVAG